MLTPATRHTSSSSCPKHMLANSKHMLVNPTWAQELDEQLIQEVLGHLRTATDTASGWAKSWHHWGLFNLALLGHHAANREPAKAQQHVAPAVVGFFRSVALGQMEGEGFVGVPSISGFSRLSRRRSSASSALWHLGRWRMHSYHDSRAAF